MKRFFLFLLEIIANICTFFVNIVIWRDKKVILFGAWMGKTFSDNSRFLYQFLSESKEQYHLSKIVWVSRDKKVVDLVRSLGYEAYSMHSFLGFYFHFKAGVHIICNKCDYYGGSPDIMTFFSFGAKKIQLWHGVGIKACGGLRQKRSKNKLLRKAYFFLSRIMKPGMWGRCYFLATSEENKRVAIADHGALPNKVIITNYPRMCYSPRLLDVESSLLEKLNLLKTSHKVILYLPTFRSSRAPISYPSQLPGFSKFLKENNFFWIEKSHLAESRNLNSRAADSNVLVLDPSLDVNTIIRSADLVITDYSSVSSDAMFLGIKTLEYCPDFCEYKDDDRGFVSDFASYHTLEPVINGSDLFATINKVLSSAEISTSQVKAFLFSTNDTNMPDIFHTICVHTRQS